LANLAVIDPDLSWTVSAKTIRAKSKNTPLDGMTLTGQNVMTILEGNIVYDNRA
jgi:dihydroorotase